MRQELDPRTSQGLGARPRLGDFNMERESLFLLSLSFLMFSSVVALSAIGVVNLGVYVALLSLSYFGDSFILRPRRRGFDFVGLGLLILFVTLTIRQVL